MSNFILNNTKFDIEKLNNENFENRKLGIKDKALDGKYLTLEKVEFSEKLEKISFFDVENIEELMALENENYGKDFVKLNEKSLKAGNSASKINDLNEKKEHRLRISSYILILIIYGIMQRVNMNLIVQGLIFGLLLSFREACFKNNSNE